MLLLKAVNHYVLSILKGNVIKLKLIAIECAKIILD